MNPTGEPGKDPLESTWPEWTDRTREAFASEWRSGGRPRIEDYLSDADERGRTALLGELLTDELAHRLTVGETLSREEYEERFPADAAIVADAFAHAATTSALRPREDRDESRPARGDDTIPDGGEPTASGAPEAAAETVTEAGNGAPPIFVPGMPTIPGFEIIGELGRGGMGVVYSARQARLNRRCALKMIRSGRLAGARETDRFLAEAEAAAKLSDPHIIQVYSLGEWEGLPYLEMEYVEGGSLADHLDGTPRPPEEAARLIETLAQAIAAAHERGIVHRDLKPANVLLTPEGRPKITDFGLAKAIDADAGLTRSEEILGTPSYMAPEQADGRARHAGPAVDVYALGAILYELLTGRPPFKGATVLETLDQVRRAEPVSPRQLVPRLPRDVETICLKCLRKEPAGRYASASALADDLRRYLEHRPIVARPLGPARRLWRWCRREPIAAALVAFVVAAAVGAAIAADQSRRGAERERAAAAQAEQNLGRARQVVEEMYSRVAMQLDDKVAMEDYQREIFQKALGFYEGFALPRSRAPEVRLEAAEAGTRIGEILLKLGRLDEAEQAYRRGLALLDDPSTTYPDAPARRRVSALLLNGLGRVVVEVGRHAEARAAYEQARDLIAADARIDTGAAVILANCETNLGNLYKDINRPDAAEAAYLAALSLQDAVARGGAETDVDRGNHGLTLNNLGVLMLRLRRPAEAMGYLRRSREVLDRVVRADPRSVRQRASLASTDHNLGLLQFETGHRDEALESYRRAVANREVLVREHPAVILYRNQLAGTYTNLGNLLIHLNRMDEASKSFRESVALREGLVRDHPELGEYANDLARSHENLAIFLTRLRRLPEALESFRAAVALREGLVRDHPGVRGYRNDLALSSAGLSGILRQLGRPAEAREPLRRAMALWQDNPQAGRVELYNLACAHAISSALIGPDRPAERRAEGDRAMIALRQSVAAGFDDPMMMWQDGDLEPLRDREDFRLLVMDLAFPRDPFAR